MSNRLRNRTEPVGLHASHSSRGMLLFGLPFFGVGVWITLVGLEMVEVDPSSVHAPMWVLTVVGLIFAASGCLIWSMGWQQYRQLKLLNKQKAKYPGEAAMADYPWNRDGYSPPRWTPARKAWSAAVFMIVFSSVFNWWAFGSGDGPLPVKIGIGVLDLILVWVVWFAIKRTWHALKFGQTRLVYDEFPYLPGETIQLRIEVPQVLRNGRSATVTLRQVLEYYEISGHGKNRNKRLVHEVKYEDAQELSETDLAQWPGIIRTEWTLPKVATGTQLHAEKPVFWELELKMEVPGLDLEQRYLLPVYTD
jgi:hypothetical protein